MRVLLLIGVIVALLLFLSKGKGQGAARDADATPETTPDYDHPDQRQEFNVGGTDVIAKGDAALKAIEQMQQWKAAQNYDPNNPPVDADGIEIPLAPARPNS